MAPRRHSAPWDRWDGLSIAFGVVVAAAVFAFKMHAFLSLAYTSDLFEHVQLARSWLEGRLLEGHSHGRMLSIHTYFFLLPLGLLAKPLGAPGLFLALAVSSGIACVFAARILRALQVSGPVAAGFGLLLVLSPFSAGHIHDKTYGFHVELLIPTMALGLLLALLQRRLLASLLAALLMISVKEDGPVLVAIIAALVLLEDFLGQRTPDGSRWTRIHGPATAVIVLAAAAFPLLLHIIHVSATQAHPHNPNGFLRLVRTREAGVTDGWGLMQFVLSQLGNWIGSRAVTSWLWCLGLATYGLVALRPHGFVLGLPLTLVAWLMDDRIDWVVRFAPSLAFAWCLSLLGFATLWRFVASGSGPLSLSRLLAVEAFVLLAVASSALAMPGRGAVEIYTFSPRSRYSRLEREQADRLFERYRREAGPDEPTVASPCLFRYAHDRNLYWLLRLEGWPRPRWILADETFASYEAYGLDAADYEVIDRLGPFSLHRVKASIPTPYHP